MGGTTDGLGYRLRLARQERRLSLAQLSSLTGFSPSFLSLVERGKSSLSLTSLQKVANGLGLSMASLLPERGPNGALVHRAHESRAAIVMGRRRSAYELLSSGGNSLRLEPMMVTYQPLDPGESEPAPYGHEGEEFCYVFEGELTFRLGGEYFVLTAGDSIHFESNTPHICFTRGPSQVRALWVLTPRVM